MLSKLYSIEFQKTYRRINMLEKIVKFVVNEKCLAFRSFSLLDRCRLQILSAISEQQHQRSGLPT